MSLQSANDKFSTEHVFVVPVSQCVLSTRSATQHRPPGVSVIRSAAIVSLKTSLIINLDKMLALPSKEIIVHISNYSNMQISR